MTSSLLGGIETPNPPLPVFIMSSFGYPPPPCKQKWSGELIDKTAYPGFSSAALSMFRLDMTLDMCLNHGLG